MEGKTVGDVKVVPEQVGAEARQLGRQITEYPTLGTTDVGSGPQGNMFGSSAHLGAQMAIDEAYAKDGPDNVVAVREKLLPIEEVEGFGVVEQIEGLSTLTVSIDKL